MSNPQSEIQQAANSNAPTQDQGITLSQTVPTQENPNTQLSNTPAFDMGHWESQKVTNETTAEFELVSIVNKKEKAVPKMILKPGIKDFNPRYAEAFKENRKKLDKDLGPTDDQGELANRILKASAMALEYLIVGWKDLFDKNGVEIPYSEENKKLIIESMPPHIKDTIVQFCSQILNFSKEPEALATTEEELKNLRAGSPMH